MTDSPLAPGVVPYIDVHDGPKRVITLDLDVKAMLSGLVRSRLSPVVSLDGRQFPVYWGRVSFQAPADRAVHVAVALDDSVQVASTLLPPGPDVLIGYQATQSGVASLVVR